jgi:hypothetical protein
MTVRCVKTGMSKYSTTTKKNVKNMFNTCLYTLINTVYASFTINIKVKAKERMTGIKTSCKHYRSLYTFKGNSNAPKLQVLHIK